MLKDRVKLALRFRKILDAPVFRDVVFRFAFSLQTAAEVDTEETVATTTKKQRISIWIIAKKFISILYWKSLRSKFWKKIRAFHWPLEVYDSLKTFMTQCQAICCRYFPHEPRFENVYTETLPKFDSKAWILSGSLGLRTVRVESSSYLDVIMISLTSVLGYPI